MDGLAPALSLMLFDSFVHGCMLVSKCMRIGICEYVSVFTFMCELTCVHTTIHTHACMRACVRASVRAFVHACVHAHTNVHSCVCYHADA